MMRALAVALQLAAALGAETVVFDWQLPKGFPKPLVPADNPATNEKALLGRYLFYDVRLSANRTQSCATCHRQELAFTDGRASSVGSTGENHPRSAMSLVNVAYAAAFTWGDPTLHSLEQQALVPMFSIRPVELGLRAMESSVLAELRGDPIYRDLFPRAFPGAAKDSFTFANIARALATFERTIISARSPYDQFHTGGKRDAISESAKRGETVFFSDPVAGCFRCHGGFNFSDAVASEARTAKVEFHNTALYKVYAEPNRGIFEHTHHLSDAGKFKAPSLRNIALTAPYMHDGSIGTLEGVLDHYAGGGRAKENSTKDRRIRPIELTSQNRSDLLAFLRSLSDEEVLRDPRFSNPW